MSAPTAGGLGQAALQGLCTPVVYPFRLRGVGRQPVVLQSRAWDEAGNVQPTRAQVIAQRGQTGKPVTNLLAFPSQHYNGPTSWAVDAGGEVKNVYA